MGCSACITVSAFGNIAALRCLLSSLMQTVHSLLSTIMNHPTVLSPTIERKERRRMRTAARSALTYTLLRRRGEGTFFSVQSCALSSSTIIAWCICIALHQSDTVHAAKFHQYVKQKEKSISVPRLLKQVIKMAWEDLLSSQCSVLYDEGSEVQAIHFLY